jgi:hypothetical protein
MVPRAPLRTETDVNRVSEVHLSVRSVNGSIESVCKISHAYAVLLARKD